MDIDKKRALVEQWYRQYAKLLFHAACLLDASDAAEETVQETFRIVLEMDNLEQVVHPKTWLRKITYHVIRNRQRMQAKAARVLVPTDDVPVEAFGSCEIESNLELEYGGIISAEDLRLLRLFAVDRCTYAEISREIGISAKACQKRVERAKKAMRKKLETAQNEIF